MQQRIIVLIISRMNSYKILICNSNNARSHTNISSAPPCFETIFKAINSMLIAAAGTKLLVWWNNADNDSYSSNIQSALVSSGHQ